ncbi:Polyadenylate-binding protein 3 [Pseudolycoriella hygida]|uniref:Polyadenylate-binding protein 3 n=1 Tax=Pseudolycoriella hygida TaxID=35572 RepID=A0A9Q0N880_9DIPT|nr:Polyadenylate-binding protein 3 [Pseudolycoriella hygida]
MGNLIGFGTSDRDAEDRNRNQPIKLPPMFKVIDKPTDESLIRSNICMITNLNRDVTEDQLRDLFGPFGLIESICVFYDDNGDSFGAGRVIFSRFCDARNAANRLNGTLFYGKTLKIKRHFYEI